MAKIGWTSHLTKLDEQETTIEQYQTTIKKLQTQQHTQQKAFEDFLVAFTAESILVEVDEYTYSKWRKELRQRR